MRLALLVALTMVAFAANSLLNRAALLDPGTGPAAFAALRVFSGAACLAALALWTTGLPTLSGRRRMIGTASLSAYMLGFSFAYTGLAAGTGALILFGGVQITMFAGALVLGERPAPARWLGSAAALTGLAWLLLPGATGAPAALPALSMAIAAMGWGVYSLNGRGVARPLAETAANFLLAAPVALAAWLIVLDGLTAKGAGLAVVSGAVTSGLGYALWYAVLPRLDASVAALTQLTVPVIALLAGAALLGEVPAMRLVVAATVVLGGVAFGVLGGRQRTASSRGS